MTRSYRTDSYNICKCNFLDKMVSWCSEPLFLIKEKCTMNNRPQKMKVLILRLDLKENESPLDENHPNQCKPPVLANQQLAEELQGKRGEGDTVPNKPIIQLLVKEPTES